jgi:hypothetical protein
MTTTPIKKLWEMGARLPWWAGYELRYRAGLIDKMDVPDRRLLERVILPWFASRGDVQTILFVGTAWYTKDYPAMFAGKTFWTMDPDPEQAPYGSEGHHLIEKVENLRQHFDDAHFDAILATGIFGWGLNTRQQCDTAFNACFACLKPGGFFMHGWDNVVKHKPVEPDSLTSLQRYERWAFEPLGRSHYPVPRSHLRHVYDFYRKPAEA